MNSEQLKYFLEVAELCHLTHAAENLNISQPALSKAIVRLENEIGSPLFDRIGRNIYLNEYGKAFLPYAESAIRAINDGKNTISSMHQQKGSVIKLQTIPLIIFPKLLDTILSRQMDASILSSAVPHYILEQNLLSKKTDLCYTSWALQSHQLSSRVLNAEPLMLIVGTDHKFSDRKCLYLSDLGNEKFISSSNHTSLKRNMDILFEHENFQPEISIIVSTINEALEYTINGLGVTLTTPSFYSDMLKRQPHGTKAIILLNKNNQPFIVSQTLYWRKNENSEAVLTTKKIFVNYFSEFDSMAILKRQIESKI